MSKFATPVKNGCLGCLGLFVFLLIFVGINAVLVMNRTSDERVEDAMLSSATAEVGDLPEATTGTDEAPQKPDAGRGWLILDLGQGEFHLHRGEPGDGVVVKAHYDANTYEVQEFRKTWPDSAWVYHIQARRTVSGLQALLAEIMDGLEATELHVYIPPDLPLDLAILMNEGGMEADLGGLWLTDLDVRYKKGGVELNIDEPLVEPLESLTVQGRMGGLEFSGVGNASPRNLYVNCTMGGVALDMQGAWSRDCDASMKLRMGGLVLAMPENIELEEVSGPDSELRRTDVEISRPVLRLRQDVKMGEIEFQ